MSADNGGAPDNGVDWFAVMELAGLWAGAVGTVAAAAIALWLASRRLRPVIRSNPSLVTRGPLQGVSWKVEMQNRSPIPVCLVHGDLYWRAPNWLKPWEWETLPAHLSRVLAPGGERKPTDVTSSYPVEIPGYQGAQVWVLCPRSHDFTTGPRWRQWLAYRSMRVVLLNATGERFAVKAPKDWQRKAPLDPQPEQARASDSTREPGTDEGAGNK